MRKLFTLLLAGLLCAGMMCGCVNKVTNENNNDVVPEKEIAEEAPVKEEAVEEEPLKEGWTYSEKKLVGYWETVHPLYGVSWGYRFNEDGTLDSVTDKQFERMGFYECRQDGVHYSPDGETWDDLVMVIVSQTDTEMTVDFAGEQTTFTKSDAELTEYMPEGWTYVEG